MTIDEVAVLLGVKKPTIYSWTHKNKIPHIKLSRRLLKFRESDILAWIEQRSQTQSVPRNERPSNVIKDRVPRKKNAPSSRRHTQFDQILNEAIKEYIQ